ncbi:OmpA family protein [Mucilaginibacter myungsuensis]|uniref:OmpA family protein n=1 Tax=Mucilaginibacter myungsuensis TaxID=649104 RepID=A0A929PWD4_9SPHI|nr:OmpA family protein [Mucilaginibacter myungsuensis]MBE9661956.1 OmpA family protein [Mucilaginibacter myungsuensis]MDN3599611.1 OmpA family protein [Mucilaginibacter myungsuensis]
MKLKSSFFILAIALAAVTVVPACKAKKPLVQPTPPVATPEPAPVTAPPKEQKAPEPEANAGAPMSPILKPDYNFKNIQFEFNSAVLKTSSYQILDKAVAEMKKDASATFTLNGYASNEGTPEHNMSLSVERANAVKTYLVNGGISVDAFTAKGFGEANPVAKGSDEPSRALNRRVEIKKK